MNQSIAILGRSFGRSALRQPIYLLIVMIPIILGIALRGSLYLIEQYRAPIDLSRVVTLILVIVAGFPPYMFGLLASLMLLEERDIELLPALQVSPLKNGEILLGKILPAGLLAAIGTPLAITLSGEAFRFGPGAIAVSGVLAVPMTAIYASVTTAICRTKVQGLTAGKILGTALSAPLIVLLLPSPWNFAGLAIPSAWSAILTFPFGPSPLWPIGAAIYLTTLALLAWRWALSSYFRG